MEVNFNPLSLKLPSFMNVNPCGKYVVRLPWRLGGRKTSQ